MLLLQSGIWQLRFGLGSANNRAYVVTHPLKN